MMNTLLKLLSATACALALSACGGGDDAAQPTPPSPGPVPPTVPPTTPPPGKPNLITMTFTPAAFDLTTHEGEALKFSLSAKSDKALEPTVRMAVIDSAGVLSTDLELNSMSEFEYQVTLQTSTVLALGSHSTELEFRLCEDDPRICKTPLPGSPWKIPLKVEVKSKTNLTPLTPLPKMANWSTYQGNASHTGYVPASFDPKNFSRRWLMWEFIKYAPPVAVTHDNGKVFSVSDGGSDSKSALLAISEETGKEAWRVDLGTVSEVSPPAAANGKVYVSTSKQGDEFIWVFDQKTGDLLSKKSMTSDWGGSLAPTIYGDHVYIRGLSKFDSITFDLMWSTSALPSGRGWTPTVDETYVYAFLSGNIYAIRAADGATEYTIADVDHSWHSSTGGQVVLSKNQTAFIVDGGRLMAFDLAGKTRAWSANGSSVGQPAYANDVIYVLNAKGTVLEAHAAATGALLWTSSALSDGGTFDQVIVTDTLAFVSSEKKTMAIDLVTHKPVWEYPLGGEMSISNRGVLYIGGAQNKLVAVNLQ